MIETGPRDSDACRLLRECLLPDSAGWPCLRFYNSKVPAEQLIPLSSRAAEAIGTQQTEVAQHSLRSPWLFPAPGGNPDGTHPFQYSTLRGQLERWQAMIGLHDADGRPVHIRAHRFRHTVGTRLINSGVPAHVVHRPLGHASPLMTATYARLHDATVREAFAAYCKTQVDIGGRHGAAPVTA